MKELTVPATLEELSTVQTFVEGELEAHACAMKTIMQISIAVEEIYVNIAHYAYHPEVGEAAVRCEIGGEPLQITIQFLDRGKPFNPLAKTDADITLSAEERNIGGLGILMVKKSMDRVDYSYEDGKNILTIKKTLTDALKG
ncbi:MAG: ATP-binding protein [Oscillospiraceae bacterium]